MRFFSTLLCDDIGATAIEYGLIAALIAIGIISAVQGIGEQVSTSFSTTSEAMAGA